MTLMKQTPRTCIVGGGLVGLAAAYQLLVRHAEADVIVLDKDPRIAAQQSTHNSGVLHAGLAYRAGSEKARLAVRGIRLMTEFCRAHGVAHEICGKIVIATTPEEVARLDRLEVQGRQNGLVGLERLPSAAAIREREPFAAGIEGLLVPEEGIVDYRGVADALGEAITRRGGRIVTDCRVEKIQRDRGHWRLVGTAGGPSFVGLCRSSCPMCSRMISSRVAPESGPRR